jgi:hypothetical protein
MELSAVMIADRPHARDLPSAQDDPSFRSLIIETALALNQLGMRETPSDTIVARMPDVCVTPDANHPGRGCPVRLNPSLATWTFDCIHPSKFPLRN